ncbi:MAG: glycosyltransferase family 2 protein [Lachnospiraceae bacterium]|nr:glycosyltransferase family 2 protein [Lachnospiraceae bacterium]
MQIVITMAGLGTRFRNAGYDMPKYEIKAHGNTLFFWSMSSLADFASPYTELYFIVRKEDNTSELIKAEAAEVFGDYPENMHIIEIDELTDGQATTAMLAAPYWDKDDQLLIYNIDTYVKPNSIRKDLMVYFEGDGFIPCFKADGDHWSFVAIDDNGMATEVREKQRISDNCTIGAYWFSSCALYEQMYKEYYGAGANMEKGEKYVAPLYNHMISKGMKVGISIIRDTDVHVLGTPEELKAFEEKKI